MPSLSHHRRYAAEDPFNKSIMMISNGCDGPELATARVQLIDQLMEAGRTDEAFAIFELLVYRGHVAPLPVLSSSSAASTILTINKCICLPSTTTTSSFALASFELLVYCQHAFPSWDWVVFCLLPRRIGSSSASFLMGLGRLLSPSS
jgi:hypothetical protein